MALSTLHLQSTFDHAEQFLARADSLDSAAYELLELVGSALQCHWGTLWKAVPDAMHLCPTCTWISLEAHAEKPERDTVGRRLTLSEGDAGHVWRTRKPIWSVDLAQDMCLPRSLDADTAGLHGGIWFALKTEGAVFGIVELLGINLSVATEDQLLGIERFEIKLGGLVEAKSVQ